MRLQKGRNETPREVTTINRSELVMSCDNLGPLQPYGMEKRDATLN